MSRVFSVRCVGAQYPNADKSNRQFFIMLCKPGEPVDLVLEPKNPADPNAIAVFAQGGQMGYINADRAAWLAGIIRQGREVTGIFQAAFDKGCYIRIGLDGAVPDLPPEPEDQTEPQQEYIDPDYNDFYPDYIPPDD